MSNLMGSAPRVEEAIVVAVPEPKFTKSWHPISHGKVINAMGGALESQGIDVVKKQYSLSQNGMDMFGIWTLDIGYGKGNAAARYAMGVRNSMQKKFAVGFCGGNDVTVCDNLQFSGEWEEFHKHTSGMSVELLVKLTLRATETVVTGTKKFAQWHTGLLDYEIAPNDEKILVYDLLDRGIVGPAKWNGFNQSLEQEKALNGSTLYSLHGAVTRQYRDDRINTMGRRTSKLNGFCDEYIEIQKAA